MGHENCQYKTGKPGLPGENHWSRGIAARGRIPDGFRAKQESPRGA